MNKQHGGASGFIYDFSHAFVHIPSMLSPSKYAWNKEHCSFKVKKWLVSKYVR